MRDAIALKTVLAARFASVGLTINDRKSNVVYIDTFERRNVKTSFTFLGYDFQVRTLKNFKGELYRKCMPGASKKAMKRMAQTIKRWRIHRSTTDSVRDSPGDTMPHCVAGSSTMVNSGIGISVIAYGVPSSLGWSNGRALSFVSHSGRPSGDLHN